MKTKLLVLIGLLSGHFYLFSQISVDSVKYNPPIIFAKLVPKAFFSAREFRPDLFGRGYASYNKTAFMENREGKSKKVFLCEFRYKAFEKYCVKNEIPYSINELKRFRRNSTVSGILYFVSVTHPFVVASIYVYEPINTKSKLLLPALVSLYLAEWFATLKIKGNAEKRLRNKVFVID